MRYSTKQQGGSGGGGSSSVASTNTNLTMGENAQAGDVLTIGGDDGLAYFALRPTDVYAALRPISSTAAVDNAPVDGFVIGSTPAAGRMSATMLSDGNIAVLTLAPTTNAPTLRIFNPTGGLVTAAVTVEALDATGATVRAIALNGGGVACIYSAAGATNPKRAIYSNAGAVVLAPAQIEAATGVASIAGCPLNDGGFLVVYQRTVGAIRQPFFARFDAAGALQGAVTQVDNISTGNRTFAADGIHATALAGGGFVVVYAAWTTGAAALFARYDAAGVLQGIKTQQGATGGGNDYVVHVCGLSDGGFAFVNWLTSNGNPGGGRHQKYTAAGAAVGAGVAFAGAAATGALVLQVARVASTNDGGYIMAVAWSGNVQVLLDKVASDGTVTALTTLSGGAPVALHYDAATTEMLVSFNAAADTTGVQKVARIKGTTVTVSANTVGTSALHTFIFGMPATVAPARNYFVGYASATQALSFNIFCTRVQKQTLAAVVGASAVAGATVPAQITGVASLRLAFTQPYSINAQGNVPPGQKLSVVGNTAILLGIQ
jgi:hypothetical protein